MLENNKTIIRVRGIIINEGKLLVVGHVKGVDRYALPGGHLDWGEGVEECLIREMVEELGVVPEIGRLLYVNNFTEGDAHNIEFFFEIKNGADYIDFEKNERTHAFEIEKVEWIGVSDNVKILPLGLLEDFKNGNILSDKVRFLKK